VGWWGAQQCSAFLEHVRYRTEDQGAASAQAPPVRDLVRWWTGSSLVVYFTISRLGDGSNGSGEKIWVLAATEEKGALWQSRYTTRVHISNRGGVGDRKTGHGSPGVTSSNWVQRTTTTKGMKYFNSGIGHRRNLPLTRLPGSVRQVTAQ